MTYAEWLTKQASFTHEGTGLRIDVRPVDKSDRIRQMIEGANRPYDLSKWLPGCELSKQAGWRDYLPKMPEAFDPGTVGQWMKSNYGASSLGLIGLLLGAGLGRKFVKPQYGALGMMLGGAAGLGLGGVGGNWLQNNGWIDAGINAWNGMKDKMKKLREPKGAIAGPTTMAATAPATPKAPGI